MLGNMIPKDLQDWWASSPIAAEIRQRRDTQRAERHAQLAGDLEALRKLEARELPALGKAAEAARSKMEAAQRALAVAEAEYAAADNRRLSASLNYSHRARVLECALQETAPAEIDGFVGELRAEVEAWRKAGNLSADIYDFGDFVTNWHTGTSRPRWSNQVFVNEWLEGMAEAIRQAEALKLRAGLDLQAEFQRIRKAIPIVPTTPEQDKAGRGKLPDPAPPC